MKATIGGKRYDTAKCEELGRITHYNHSNNEVGWTTLERATDGVLLVFCDSRDIFLRDYLILFSDSELTIDSFKLDEQQEKRCAELGLIKIV